MKSKAVYAGDVCFRDDFVARWLVVYVDMRPAHHATAVNLVDRPVDPQCSGDRSQKRGSVESFGPNILSARRVATVEEMAFAWGKYLSSGLSPDRCGRCYEAALEAVR